MRHKETDNQLARQGKIQSGSQSAVGKELGSQCVLEIKAIQRIGASALQGNCPNIGPSGRRGPHSEGQAASGTRPLVPLLIFYL